jgi:hypothetical protein
MKARRTSTCPVCDKRINPGDEITHVEDIGWIHDGCEAVLDNPVEQSYMHVQLYGPNVLTVRDEVIYNLNLDASEEDYHAYSMLPGYWADYVD